MTDQSDDLEFSFFPDATDGTYRSRLLAVVRLQHIPIRFIPSFGRLCRDERAKHIETSANQAGSAIAASRLTDHVLELALPRRRR